MPPRSLPRMLRLPAPRPARRTAAGIALLLVAAGPAAAFGAADPGPSATIERAAQVNDRDPEALAELVEDDPTAEIGDTGRLRYVEPAPRGVAAAHTADEAAAGTDAAGEGASGASAAAAYPLDQTFALHSLPGSRRTILLDFDGGAVSGSEWNNQDGLSTAVQPAWSLDGDATTFNEAERTAIQSIWARVAEDYAPFDVDVTTQDTGSAAIDRSGLGDEFYGTRVLISPSSEAMSKICGSSCGGVAWVDVFAHYPGRGNDKTGHEGYQPAWVFPQALSNGTKSIAEAASHEAGHTFGLDHDGKGTSGYYAGAAGWAPIMGVGYQQPITQWSSGEYAGATNPGQDDVAVIAASAPYRADDAGDTLLTAASRLPVDPAVIGTRGDVDVYSLGRCSGAVTVTATPAPTSPDLDIALSLLDATGAVVARVDPTSAASGTDAATGLGAEVSRTLADGTWYVAVDGVGRGTVSSGYSDYGSLGAYSLARSGSCTYATPTAPSAPTALTAALRASGSEADVAWRAPASDGGSALTGYDVALDGSALGTVAPGQLTSTLTGLSAGRSYVGSVRARNAVGAGPWAQVTLSVPAAAAGSSSGTGSGSGAGTVTSPDPVTPPALATPRAPAIRRAVPGRAGGRVTATARWSAPRVGAAGVDGYRVLAQRLDTRGRVVAKATSPVTAAGATSLVLRLAPGRWRFRVEAHNAAGWGMPSLTSAAVVAR